MGAREDESDAAARRPCVHAPPPRRPPRCSPHAAPRPAAPRRPARHAPRPALRLPLLRRPAPGRPCSPSSFSAVCPVKTLPGSRVPTTANPPLVTSSPAASALAPSCYGNAPRAPGRCLEGLGFGCRCPEAGRARGRRRRRGAGGRAREARAAPGAPVAAASRLNSELGASCSASGTRNGSCAIRTRGDWGDVIRGPAPDGEGNFSLLLRRRLLHTRCWRRVLTEHPVDCSAPWTRAPGVVRTGEWAAVRIRDSEV